MPAPLPPEPQNCKPEIERKRDKKGLTREGSNFRKNLEMKVKRDTMPVPLYRQNHKTENMKFRKDQISIKISNRKCRLFLKIYQ